MPAILRLLKCKWLLHRNCITTNMKFIREVTHFCHSNVKKEIKYWEFQFVSRLHVQLISKKFAVNFINHENSFEVCTIYVYEFPVCKFWISFQWEEFMSLSSETSDMALQERLAPQAPNKCCTLIYTVCIFSPLKDFFLNISRFK